MQFTQEFNVDTFPFWGPAKAVVDDEDIDRGEYAPVGKFSRQNDFHIARSLELFENNVVHTRARFDERGRNDG